MARTCRAVLLAGGLGTRLRPLTDSVPKCLVPIAGQPMIDYWFDSLQAASVHELLVNTHHLRDAVQSHLQQAMRERPLTITEAYEPKLLGSAGTIHENASFMDGADDCLIVYADNLSNVDLAAALEFHRGHGDPMTMLLFHTPYPSQCGIAELDGQGRIVEFVEKPEHPKSDLANAGVYVVDAAAYREIAEMDAFDLGFDVLPRFVGRMSGYVIDGYHRDIGNHEALEQARKDAPKVFGRRG